LYESYKLIDSVQQNVTPVGNCSNKDWRPPPPRGMLSIQNYTDIAAILEFTICTSLIPCLDDNILTPIRERAQYLLPKAIAGRLPRLSLLWGVANSKIKSCQRKEERIKELDNSVSLIGGLVLLDRFRPMLLPRHLADLYAGLFQTEHLEEIFCLQSNNSFSRKKPILPWKEKMFNKVDSLNQARAYQILLLRGMKAPLWVRKRVSRLLADLAVKDIRAIVQIWVKSSSSSEEDMTAAALRLATALASSNDEDYFRKLCEQLVHLLDFDSELTGQNFAYSLTVWAFVELLPEKKRNVGILTEISDGLFHNPGSDSIGLCLRRIIALLSAIPITSQKTNTMCILLLSDLPKQPEKNMFNQILRIASTLTIEQTKLKSDAITALRMACLTIGQASFSETGLVEGPILLSLVLLRSILPSEHDSFVQTSNYSYIQDIERRASVLMDNVILPVQEHDIMESNANLCSNLPHILFHHMLLIIFEVARHGKQLSYLHTAVMIMLPLLCDQCPQEKLLLGTADDSTGMLETFNVILNCAAAFVDQSYQWAGENASEKRSNLVSANNLLNSFATNKWSITEGMLNEAQFLDGTLLSTTSIILSLLIAILELGTKHRNQQELEFLKASLPQLQILSSVKFQDSQIDANLGRLCAEVAEMASYAALLVVSRTSTKEEREPTKDSKKHRTYSSIIEEAAKNLNSSHPALRAEGAAQLRYLAIGCLAEKGEKLPKRSMIQEVSEPLSTVASVKMMEEILRLVIHTLSDPESYVYMAGIQTIAAIADVKPHVLIPSISLAICTGILKVENSSQTITIPENDRIKLSEALFCIIQRRGTAISQYGTQLLRIMIYGNQQSGQEPSQSDAPAIQEETHEYFLGCADDTNDLTESSDDLEGKKLRVNTGGPIFEVELNFMLRSSCILIVAEVINNLEFPKHFALHVSELVQLVTSAIYLEKSRLVRRAVAFLAAVLYNAALREAQGEFDLRSLIVELVISGEAKMEAALVSVLSQDSGSSQHYDPALRARCEEALKARADVVETGAFSIAALYLEEQKRENRSHTVVIIKKRLNEAE